MDAHPWTSADVASMVDIGARQRDADVQCNNSPTKLVHSYTFKKIKFPFQINIKETYPNSK